jgi:hypothetical protein
MKKKGRLILIIIFIFLLPTCYIVIKHAFNYLSGYLSKSEQVKANILLVEGWLPDYALKIAYERFQKNKYDYIFTTGINSFTEYSELWENGYLIFHSKINKSLPDVVSKHKIEVEAYGSLSGTHSAHFNLFVNGSLIADFFADKHKRSYSADWKGSLSEIDSLMVQFTNDRVDEYGDINLFVKEIVIDHKISIPYLNNSEYDMSELNGKRRIVNNSTSFAEIARKRLLSMGLDSTKVIAVPGAKVKINRTLTSAFAFRDWLNKSKIDITGINIISLGAHARRTWMTYNKILKEKYAIGIISIPDYMNDHSKESKVLKTLRETLGIIYYWLILIPY